MKVTLRNDRVEVSGYVNAVGRESRPLRDGKGYFIETIAPGVFARALSRGKRQMLLNHNHERVLAEEGNGLELKEDAVGLFARAEVTDAEVIEKAKQGKLRGWSFGFKPLRESEDERGGMRHRTIDEVDLYEVSLIDDRMRPAYQATSVFTRDDSQELEIRSMDGQEVDVVDRAEVIDYSAYLSVVDELVTE